MVSEPNPLILGRLLCTRGSDRKSFVNSPLSNLRFPIAVVDYLLLVIGLFEGAKVGFVQRQVCSCALGPLLVEVLCIWQLACFQKLAACSLALVTGPGPPGLVHGPLRFAGGWVLDTVSRTGRAELI